MLLAAGAPVDGLRKAVGSPLQPELLRRSSPLLLALRYAVERVGCSQSPGGDVNVLNADDLYDADNSKEDTDAPFLQNMHLEDSLGDNEAALDARLDADGASRTQREDGGEEGALALARLLIDANCDVNRADHDGRTPLELARATQFDRVEALLLEHGATSMEVRSATDAALMSTRRAELAAVAGPPRARSTFGVPPLGEDEWHAYQEVWYRAFVAEELPPVKDAMRRVLWKQATREHERIASNT